MGVQYATGIDYQRYRTPSLPIFGIILGHTRNDEDVGLHCMFEIVRSYMNGRFSVISGKDVTIENLGYYQTKPTSSKLFHTQTSIQIISLLFSVADADIIFLPCGFFLFLSFCLFYSSPILTHRRLDVYHTSTHGVALMQI